MVQKQCVFSGNHAPDSELCSSPDCGMWYRPLVMLGSEPQLLVSSLGSAPPYTHSHSGPGPLFCFSLPVQPSIYDMRYSILIYKTAFVSGNFAQL